MLSREETNASFFAFSSSVVPTSSGAPHATSAILLKMNTTFFMSCSYFCVCLVIKYSSSDFLSKAFWAAMNLACNASWYCASL